NPGGWYPFGTKVDYCLSERLIPQCKMFASLPLTLLVSIMNALRIIAMVVVFFQIDSKPLLTLGDGIASFIENPDQYTRDMCLCGSEHFRLLAYKKTEWGPVLKPWVRKKRRWYSVVRVRRCMNKGSTEMLAMVFFTNLPQAVLSLAYFTYNNLFTCMLQDVEWHGFSTTPKPLRVSGSPRGIQRKTYFLHLPYRFAIPLIVLSGILNWVASQSLFLVHVQYLVFPICDARFTDCGNLTSSEALKPQHYSADQFRSVGLSASNSEITTCGFAPIGTLSVMLLAVLLLFGAWVAGRRQLEDGGLPVVGSCSAAIAAACHPVDYLEKIVDSEKPLKWGVVFADAERELGHCALSSEKVTGVDLAYLYSGMSTATEGSDVS
ncbi:hypothetical protein DL98DRAFT_616641, partial [Cadophora sp. DSE1049]